VGSVSFDRLPSVIGDNAEFAILARAVAAGHGLRYLNDPGLKEATKYPPGFPLMLAMWIPFFGDSMLVMKIVVLVMYVLAVDVAFLLARKLVDETLSVIAALIFATSASILPYSHEVLSDIPYALFGLIALVLIMGSRVPRRSLIAGLAVSFWAYVVRTAGVSLVAAVGVYLFLKAKRREALLLTAAVVLFSAAWAVRNHYVASGGSPYLKVLLSKNPYNPDLGMVGPADVARRVWVNFGAYIGGLLPFSFLPTFLGHVSDGPSRTMVSLAILAVTAIGGYALRRKGLLPNLYLAAYMAVYLVWPEVWRTERFMLAIAPIAAVYLVAGVDRICRYVGLKRAAVLVLSAAIAATNLYSFSEYARRQRGYPAGWANYFSAAAWAKSNTGPDAVFLCRSAYLFYIASGRRTIQYPFTANTEAMRAYLAKSHPDYIVIDDVGFPQTDTYLVPALRTIPQTLEKVFATGEPINLILKFSVPAGGIR
jgi:hypothetical protein